LLRLPYREIVEFESTKTRFEKERVERQSPYGLTSTTRIPNVTSYASTLSASAVASPMRESEQSLSSLPSGISTGRRKYTAALFANPSLHTYRELIRLEKQGKTATIGLFD
jgi:hypothetical protein